MFLLYCTVLVRHTRLPSSKCGKFEEAAVRDKNKSAVLIYFCPRLYIYMSFLQAYECKMEEPTRAQYVSFLEERSWGLPHHPLSFFFLHLRESNFDLFHPFNLSPLYCHGNQSVSSPFALLLKWPKRNLFKYSTLFCDAI